MSEGASPLSNAACRPRRAKAPASSDIAIIGMACMFPRADDRHRFWTNLLGKLSALGEPDPAWGAGRYYDPEDASGERLYTKTGGFLRDAYRFNPAEFGIMPNSVDGSEPDQFLALKAARDALADAGYMERSFDRARTGIILGHSTYLHRGNAGVVQHGVVLDQTVRLLEQLHPELTSPELAEIRSLLKAHLPPFDADTAPGLVPNVMTGRIANRLDLNGPNYLIDAACASSLLAVQAAARELQSGHCDLMLAGGVNASIPAEVLLVFTQLGALSRSSRVRPFDASADGTLLGEGLGVVVLKRHADAVRDGDRIYAVVKSIAQSSDGRGRGLLAPRLEGEALAIQRAYAEAGVDPRSIGLVEAHGTGIPLGDRTEIEALASVFGGRSGELPRCGIGSVKSMIGHCIPAAGIAGLIKCALALYHKTLPPTLCDEVNPALELERTPFYVNTETRPWICAPGRPRRAALNAFGFGGINAHALLQEADGEAAEATLAEWPSELVVLAAATRPALLERARRVVDYLSRAERAADGTDLRLRDVAATLAADALHGPQRLAVVATDLEELARKLERACRELADADRQRLQVRSGIYFRDQPAEGGLAVLFPGEGAQYVGMLADLAVHFPVVRRWFDFWDSLYESEDDFLPSAAVFPPPTAVGAPARARLEARLNDAEVGSEASFIACQAIFDLLRPLGLQVDAMAGHSSGENSALMASGAIRADTPAKLRRHIDLLKQVYQVMESGGDVATGVMMTVGVVDRDRVLALVEASDGALHLAVDNCPHQSVLFGSQEAIDGAAAELRARGGLCVLLDINRAYHTPWFEPVCEGLEPFYRDVPLRQPRVSVYSCASAAPLPTSVADMRRVVVSQWAARVRFSDTVERMYEDGIRTFLEVGPASNLTNFVHDILRDRDHLAVSMDNRKRPGLVQLQHTLARLFVEGRTLDLGVLWARRGVRALDLAAAPVQRPKAAPRVDNTLPFVSLTDEEVARVKAMFRPREPAPDGGANFATQAPARAGRSVSPSTVAADPEALATHAHGDAGLDLAMQRHFELMRAFLGHQERILGAEGLGPDASAAPWPFLARVLKLDAEEAVAEFDLDVEEHDFLRHHVLYASRVSDLDPSLQALSVVPLAVSLEMLAEIAALLGDGQELRALENVRAHDWVALDDGLATVRMTARRLSVASAGERFRATLHCGQVLVLEGDIVLDSRRELAAVLPPLSDPRPAVTRDDELYGTGMFHGPMFRSVRHIAGWDGTGIDARIAPTATREFFGGGEQPRFLLDPILVDAVGQLTAYWLEQQRRGDFSTFPSTISRIEFGASSDQPAADCVLRGRIRFEDPDRQQFLSGEFECLGPDGSVLYAVHGWRDRYLSVPHRFYAARTRPKESWLGEDWSARFGEAFPDVVVCHVAGFPRGFLEDMGGISKRLLAQTVLGREEREIWRELRAKPQRGVEWLLGRVALKEAARRWIVERQGVFLFPADVAIGVDEDGRPWVAQDGLESLGSLPEVSLAHAENAYVAVAGPPGQPIGIDLETIGRIRLEDLLRGGFTSEERSYVESWPEASREDRALRLWCAKEATAKSLGSGLNGNPARFRVQQVSDAADFALVATDEGEISVVIASSGNAIVALAGDVAP